MTALALTTTTHAFDMRLAERAGVWRESADDSESGVRVPVIHSAMLQKSDTPPDVLAICERNRRSLRRRKEGLRSWPLELSPDATEGMPVGPRMVSGRLISL